MRAVSASRVPLAQPVGWKPLAARLVLQLFHAALGLGEALLGGLQVVLRLRQLALQVAVGGRLARVTLQLVDLSLQRGHELLRSPYRLAALRRLVAPARLVLAQLLRG